MEKNVIIKVETNDWTLPPSITGIGKMDSFTFGNDIHNFEPSKVPNCSKTGAKSKPTSVHYNYLELITFNSYVPMPKFALKGNSKNLAHCLKCPVCYQRYGRILYYRNHVFRHRRRKWKSNGKGMLWNYWTKNVPYYCKVDGCERKFRTKIYLEKHELSRHRNWYKGLRKKVYQRLKKSLSKKKFQEGFYVNIGRGYHCHKCLGRFCKVEGLKRHFSRSLCPNKPKLGSNSKSKSKPRLSALISSFCHKYCCKFPSCSQSFPSHLHLKTHLRKNHNYPQALVEGCEIMKRRIVPKSKLGYCVFCEENGNGDASKKFERLYGGWTDHVKSQHSEMLIKCPYRLCKETFMGHRDASFHVTKSPSIHPFTHIPDPKPKISTQSPAGIIVEKMYKANLICPWPRCGLKFENKELLAQHSKESCRFSPPPPPPQPQAEPRAYKRAAARLPRARPITKKKYVPQTEKKFMCQQKGCGQGFVYFKSYARHANSHHQGRQRFNFERGQNGVRMINGFVIEQGFMEDETDQLKEEEEYMDFGHLVKQELAEENELMEDPLGPTIKVKEENENNDEEFEEANFPFARVEVKAEVDDDYQYFN